jgi:hypothetical protein
MSFQNVFTIINHSWKKCHLQGQSFATKIVVCDIIITNYNCKKMVAYDIFSTSEYIIGITNVGHLLEG